MLPANAMIANNYTLRPPSSFREWHYAKCEDFVGSKNKMIKWDPPSTLNAEALVGRDVCMYFGSHHMYYRGKIEQYVKTEKKKPYRVLFEDGEIHSFSEKKILECLRIYFLPIL